MMARIEQWQIKSIYAMGGSLGLVDRGREDDNLHLLVAASTGKAHISDLSRSEASDIIGVLKERMRGAYKAASPAKKAPPAGCTAGQKNKVWYLMYELEKYDDQPSSASLGERLAGIIKRELHIDASAKDPLRWLSYPQASKLIESIKRYIATAESRRRRADG